MCERPGFRALPRDPDWEPAVGALVRSYDFPDMDDAFIEGAVVRILESNYAIKVDRVVYDGEEKPLHSLIGEVVLPPRNGQQLFFRSAKACGVVALVEMPAKDS